VDAAIFLIARFARRFRGSAVSANHVASAMLCPPVAHIQTICGSNDDQLAGTRLLPRIEDEKVAFLDVELDQRCLSDPVDVLVLLQQLQRNDDGFMRKRGWRGPASPRPRRPPLSCWISRGHRFLAELRATVQVLLIAVPACAAVCLLPVPTLAQWFRRERCAAALSAWAFRGAFREPVAPFSMVARADRVRRPVHLLIPQVEEV
jgi:hypothetical protein